MDLKAKRDELVGLTEECAGIRARLEGLLSKENARFLRLQGALALLDELETGEQPGEPNTEEGEQ